MSRMFESSTPAKASSSDMIFGASSRASLYLEYVAANKGIYIAIALSPPLNTLNLESVSSLYPVCSPLRKYNLNSNQER
ncbi:hypothetical protein D3C75_1265770 [compost metagenome]